MERYVLLHYSEIGLKGDFKRYFVERLRRSIQQQLVRNFGIKYDVKHVSGRFLVPLKEEFSYEDEEAYTQVLRRVFGVRSFKFVWKGGVDVAALTDEMYAEWERFQNFYSQKLKMETFRVSVKRSMLMEMNSVESERLISGRLLEMGLDLKAKMKGFDLNFEVEFFNDMSFFSFTRHEGWSGLPAGTQGRLVSLISSGIDSPVAAFKMMKRGARIAFVHFSSYPYSDVEELEQVKDLVKILAEYQCGAKLYVIPFGEIQKRISLNTEIPGRFATLLFRRLMLRVAEVISLKEEARGLVTGDGYGQVASQTPENLFAVHDASTIPLFQPLIAFDKEETVNFAKKIGTFEISKLPCKDTCTMLVSGKPEVKAKTFDIRKYEAMLPVQEWVDEAISKLEVVHFD